MTEPANQVNYDFELGEIIKRLQDRIPGGVTLEIKEDEVKMYMGDMDGLFDINDIDAEVMGKRIYAAADLWSVKDD